MNVFLQVLTDLAGLGVSDAKTIISVVILASLLSLDNSLVVAAIAEKLPRHQEQKAIMFGLAAGIAFRLIALFAAGFIIEYPIVRTVGALYLVFIAWKHFWGPGGEEERHHAREHLGAAIVAIALADVAFSVDNVVATVAMSPKIAVVLVGTLVGGIAMIFTTKLVLVLIKRYQLLEGAAYGIVAFVGLTILAETCLHIDISETLKFCVVLGTTLSIIGYEELQHRLLHRKRVAARPEVAPRDRRQ